MTTRTLPRTIQAADLYGDVPPEVAPRWRELVPGLAVTALAALAAAYLSDHYHAPTTLMALLIGLSVNFLGADRRLHPGLGFASRTLLRVGIVAVGARVTLGQVAALGWPALAAIVAITAATLLVGVLTARRLGYGTAFGVLAGGAVAICGASAAMALAAVLGRRVDEARLTLVLVGIAAASAFAMVAYPVVAHLLRFDSAQAGFMLGASVHDVAQALGAGYSFSREAGDGASIVKLTRVALLAPTLAIVAWAGVGERGRGGVAALAPPWFVVGFFLLAAAHSAGLVPRMAADGAGTLATALLVCAVTATGIRSRMGLLLAEGVRPLLVIVAASATALLLAAGAAALLIR